MTIPDPPGLVVSTATLAIFRFDGLDWSSATVTNQSISTQAGTGIISATGTITSTGYYALFFVGIDTTAPVTSFGFDGSTRAFAQTVLVSTNAFAVLVATDAWVNGFASGIATTYYRIDPASSTTSYSVYTTSVPLPLGFHVLQWYSRDFAGNDEVVRTSTFVVTAGTLAQGTANLSVRGSCTGGFLPYGAQMDVQSRAEDSYTLLLSSTDTSPVWVTTNIGQSIIGDGLPDSNFDVIPASPGVPALALRSGNASTATPSFQIAFGYNGDVSMRHAVRTEHAPTTAGNAVDFLLWSPITGSTATIGDQRTLSIQGVVAGSSVSFHVHPATGTADAEVEVSDGYTIGNGVVHAIGSYQHSSRALKSHIAPLTSEDRAQSVADVLSLRHAGFKYKRSPYTPRKGLIYEESPPSIRGEGKSVVFDERLINAELALQDAMKRLETLQKKLKTLKEAQP